MTKSSADSYVTRLIVNCARDSGIESQLLRLRKINEQINERPRNDAPLRALRALQA